MLHTALFSINVDMVQIGAFPYLKVTANPEEVQFDILIKPEYKVNVADEKLVLVTTRLEKMFGGTAVAVHSGDQQY